MNWRRWAPDVMESEDKLARIYKRQIGNSNTYRYELHILIDGVLHKRGEAASFAKAKKLAKEWT